MLLLFQTGVNLVSAAVVCAILESISGMDKSPVHWVWPKPSCKVQRKGEEDKADRKKEMGRQHQGMDRPGVRQVPEGRAEQRNIEETGYEVICGAPTIPIGEGRWKNFDLKNVYKQI